MWIDRREYTVHFFNVAVSDAFVWNMESAELTDFLGLAMTGSVILVFLCPITL